MQFYLDWLNFLPTTFYLRGEKHLNVTGIEPGQARTSSCCSIHYTKASRVIPFKNLYLRHLLQLLGLDDWNVVLHFETGIRV